jgi:hypothetical protein
MVKADPKKRVRKVTLLKAGQVLIVRAVKRCRISLRVPEGTEIAIEGKPVNNHR